jgi:hypothetical protein
MGFSLRNSLCFSRRNVVLISKENGLGLRGGIRGQLTGTEVNGRTLGLVMTFARCTCLAYMSNVVVPVGPCRIWTPICSLHTQLPTWPDGPTRQHVMSLVLVDSHLRRNHGPY